MGNTPICSSCGATLAADAPRGICPQCLLKAGLPSQSRSSGTIVLSEDAAMPRLLPCPGERYGGYQIIRELGRGGMGAVYEADHIETGRRVALKVLGHKLDSPEARKRFLREGRLAASINHPNSVYVYGTEEIEGAPAIAMELVAGGTLQARVERQGPMPLAAAVDAALQVVAGLEAAQALGILHRDIKPSNCFEDADGTVKIGDFGLSLSTAARADATSLTIHGAFLGTPAFCSPEQLRGEELNARSDLYAVGVTLFYLLTGRTPFAGHNFVQLLANVLEQPAPSPRQFRPEIPQELARVVLRCLEKQSSERFKNYTELRQALAPFASAALRPANPGLRLAAGFLDTVLLGAVATLACLLLSDEPSSVLGLLSMAVSGGRKLVTWAAWSFFFMLLYYTLLEGLMGASLGKLACGLRVLRPNRCPPGLGRALLRALIFLVVPPLPFWVAVASSPKGWMEFGASASGYAMSLAYYLLLALLFFTMRQRNGFASVHDLATGTRVVRKPAHHARPLLAMTEEATEVPETSPVIGPYHVLRSLGRDAFAEWLLAYDTRLLRKVWVRLVPPGTPPLESSLRNLGRPGRLRWITGRRLQGQDWDAFEAVTGQPLLQLIQRPQPWGQVRFWLLDLAAELAAAQREGTLPRRLDLDRVWISADGRAKLLDVPAPGVQTCSEAGPPVSPQRFLAITALAALEGRVPAFDEAGQVLPRIPLPLHARAFLAKLPSLPGVDAMADALRSLTDQLAAVSRLRRAGLVGACLVMPFLGALGMGLGLRTMLSIETRQPELFDLIHILQLRDGWKMANRFIAAGQSTGPDDRAIGIYIASHYRRTITNAAEWSSPLAFSMVKGDSRRFAEQSLTNYPSPTELETLQSEKQIKPLVDASLRDSRRFLRQRWFLPVACGIGLVVYVGVPSLLAALAFRGGLLLRIFGVAVVRSNGERASRLLAFCRAILAWLPVFLGAVLMAVLIPKLGAWRGSLPSLTLVLGLTILSLALPTRGLQDRLAGTFLVPR